MANKKQQASSGLDQYISANRTTNWMILIFVLTLICMVIVWAFIGTMKTTVPVTGIQKNGHFVGYIMPKDALSLEAGMPMEYDGNRVGILTSRGTTALSAEEIAAAVDNMYYLNQLDLHQYNLELRADTDGSCPDGVITLDIVVGETRPFDFFR